MNRTYLRAVTAFFAAAMAAKTLHAESPYTHELDRLVAERDKALAAAAEPVKRKYQPAFEDLLRRATKSADQEAIAKIREAMAGPARGQSDAAPPTPIDPAVAKIKTKRALQKALVGTSWNVAWKKEGPYFELLIFVTDKDVQFAAGKMKWEATDDRAVIIDGAKFVFDEALQTFECAAWGRPVSATANG